MQNQTPIPVICDRCRTEGTPGDDNFADLGDLLDFPPVPRKTERVDGWFPECQRKFIAALASTGSPRRAAAAVGKAQWGADQLRRARGGQGFDRAWDRAMLMFKERGSQRLSAGLEAVAKEAAAWQPAQGPWSKSRSRGLPPPPPQPTEEELAAIEALKLKTLDSCIAKYHLKLGEERKARIEGRIVEADTYLRQITFLEVCFDLLSEGHGLQALLDFRHRGMHLVEIAETPLSTLLDETRRRGWEAAGDPPRPAPPSPEDRVDHGDCSTQNEHLVGGAELTPQQQRRRFDDRHRQAAEAQLRWEEEARREYESRRDSST